MDSKNLRLFYETWTVVCSWHMIHIMKCMFLKLILVSFLIKSNLSHFKIPKLCFKWLKWRKIRSSVAKSSIILDLFWELVHWFLLFCRNYLQCARIAKMWCARIKTLNSINVDQSSVGAIYLVSSRFSVPKLTK